jgi:hypothetical protein
MNDEEKREEKKYYPTWFFIVGSLVGILAFLGEGIIGLIGVVIGYACGCKCFEWAKEIDSNTSFAFLIGLLLGLFGLFGYFIYYKYKVEKNES